LAGAAPAPEPIRTAQAQAKFDKLLAGRVAGETKVCLNISAINNPIAIDDRTMLLRDGHPALPGDKVQIVDMKGGCGVGACTPGDFTPYAKP